MPRAGVVSETVVLVPDHRGWPARFDQERAHLEVVFAGGAPAIEHIGSTAVPGLGAKPVIDIMVGLPDLAEAERRIPALEAAGYEYVQKHERQIPEPPLLPQAARRSQPLSSALRRHG